MSANKTPAILMYAIHEGYLESLPEWDKVPRIHRWTEDYYGCRDEQYSGIGIDLLVQLAMRALHPGCNVGLPIILDGYYDMPADLLQNKHWLTSIGYDGEYHTPVDEWDSYKFHVGVDDTNRCTARFKFCAEWNSPTNRYVSVIYASKPIFNYPRVIGSHIDIPSVKRQISSVQDQLWAEVMYLIKEFC